ncbi:MAG: extracellular solute-binding protein [Bacilli bacterium]
MKKFIIIIAHFGAILAIILTLGLTAKSKVNIDNKFNGVLEKGCTIRVLENDTAIKQGYLKELLDAFNEKYKEYEIVAVDANMDQFTDLEQDGPHGYGPDVLYQANDRLMRYVDGKHIRPIPNELINDYSNINETSWSAFTRLISGSKYTFAVPVNIQGPLLYYRKDLLPSDWKTAWDDNKNQMPDMLENWNSMYQYSNKLHGDEKLKEFGYMRSFLEPYFSSGYLFSYGGYAFGDNNTNQDDIGFSAGDSYKGASVIRQLASQMDERCIDDTITTTAYSELAKGRFFATITTPDVYTLFADELKKEHGKDINIDDYLGVSDIPMLPKSGNLEEKNPNLIPCKMMGGIHGYALSSYSKFPNASLEFINFATSYEKIKRRNELLGIVPAREDTAKDIGGLSEVINNNMKNGLISIMPSIKAVGQIWTPLQTFFQDVAKDPFRKSNEMKYLKEEDFKSGLKKVDKQIYDAIHTLQ